MNIKQIYNKLKFKIKKPKILIYTDSRGVNISDQENYDHYPLLLCKKYIVEKYLTPEKWTTTLDFLQLIKTKNISDYDLIILHTGIVDHSPRHQKIAINKIYKDKKSIFDEVFGAKRIQKHLKSDFGIEYEGDKTINLYSLELAKNYLLPKLKIIPNLVWISSNIIVPNWIGNYWKERPSNINLIEKYSDLFLSELNNTINLMSWDYDQVKKYTYDNMHPNKAGSDYIYTQLEYKISELLSK